MGGCSEQEEGSGATHGIVGGRFALLGPVLTSIALVSARRFALVDLDLYKPPLTPTFA